MKWGQFFVLLAVIFLAPHIRVGAALVWAGAFLISALLYVAWKGKP